MAKLFKVTEEEITEMTLFTNMLSNAKQSYSYKSTKTMYFVTVNVDEDSGMKTTFVFDKKENLKSCYEGSA